MKRILSVLCAAAAVTFYAGATVFPELEPFSCTSIMVGKKASTDGAVITSHTCDGNYRTWVDIVPSVTYQNDTVVNVFQNRLHTESAKGSYRMTLKGSIFQPAGTTFRFVDTAYPCLNEKQLAMGETTITGRRELVNPEGMFMIEELQKIALQRCSTARDAIRLMGELIEEYGYGDWGECLTIADKNEVWHFEVFGEGTENIGGVWAAVRIPDDHVGVSANISRISSIDLSQPDYYMASDNVFEVAERLGFWDGKEPFCFWKAYAGGNYYGEDKSFHLREFFILDKLAPSLHLSFDSRELPISVKPDKLVSAEEVMALLAETYEGTEYDVTRNLKVTVKDRRTREVDTVISPAANPWMTADTRNMLNALKPGSVDGNRLVAVPQCSYSTVIELHADLPDAVGGVLWIAFDNPGQSPRIPIFCGTTSLPDCFSLCGQYGYDENAVVWKFRRANKLATVRWGAVRDEVFSAVAHFKVKGVREEAFVRDQYARILAEDGEEAAQTFLTGYTADFAGAAILTWEEMADRFWTRFARGF